MQNTKTINGKSLLPFILKGITQKEMMLFHGSSQVVERPNFVSFTQSVGNIEVFGEL